jgi:hypothetical protein
LESKSNSRIPSPLHPTSDPGPKEGLGENGFEFGSRLEAQPDPERQGDPSPVEVGRLKREKFKFR